MTEEYKFKTDRKVQWKLIEERYIKEGYPRNVIDNSRAVFHGDINIGNADKLLTETVLAYWPDRTISGWQNYFDNYCTEKLSRSRIFGLQTVIISGFFGNYQAPEDDAYYVRNLWGEEWKPESLIKLRIPAEEGAMIPLDPNVVFSACGSTLSCWLSEREGEISRGGYIRFMPDFFRSLIPYIDLRVFDTNNYKFKQKVSDNAPASISKMKAVVKRFIVESRKPLTGNPFYDERIIVAKQFYSMFNEIKENLGDFSLFVEKSLSEES